MRATVYSRAKSLVVLFGLAGLACGCQLGKPGAVAAAQMELESASAKQEGCRPLRSSTGQIQVVATAKGTGRQCLVQDLVQRNIYEVPSGRNRGSPMYYGVISFYQARDLDLDLRGHLVSGEPFDDTTGINEDRRSTHLRVHNGTVRTPGKKGLGVLLAPYKDQAGFVPSLEDQSPMSEARRTTNGSWYSQPWDYQPATHFTVDNLNIFSGGRGVVLAGTGNVLRNSVIEVDSPVAVLIYGPGAIIEGNTFIISRPLGQTEGPTEAALKLRDAHGAVIRNNMFLVKGLFASKAQVAINLLESRDVVIEGNTVKGARSLVRKDAASSTIERGNTID